MSTPKESALIEYNKLKTLIAERQAFEKAHPIKPYINHTTRLTFPNVDGWSLLQLAVKTGDLDEVKRLVEIEDIPVSHAMVRGHATALKVAFYFGNKEIVEYLLSKGASITECDRENIHDNTDCLAIYDEKAREILNPRDENVYYDSIIPKSEKSYADLTAEIGDEKFFANHLHTIHILDMSNALHKKLIPLHRAVANKQDNILHYY